MPFVAGPDGAGVGVSTNVGVALDICLISPDLVIGFYQNLQGYSN